MSEIEEFKKKQYGICTSFPLFEKIENDLKLYRKLSRRSEEDFGENLFGKSCAKREMCTGNCLGRPVPKYKEIQELVKDYDGDYETGIYKNQEVYLFKATLCSTCPFAQSCAQPCDSLESFLEKDESGVEPYENRIVEYRDYIDYDNFITFQERPKESPVDIPWNVLSLEQTQVVELRALYCLTWKEVAQEMNQRVSYSRRLFQRAIKKLKRVAKAIKRTKQETDASVDLFIKKGLTIEEIAEKQGIANRTVYNRLAKILNPSSDQ